VFWWVYVVAIKATDHYSSHFSKFGKVMMNNCLVSLSRPKVVPNMLTKSCRHDWKKQSTCWALIKVFPWPKQPHHVIIIEECQCQRMLQQKYRHLIIICSLWGLRATQLARTWHPAALEIVATASSETLQNWCGQQWSIVLCLS